MDQPLKGIRVLDFTHLLPGELLSALLSDLGAEIVRIEAPSRGLAHRLPPVVEGESLYYWALNKRKKRLVINLKDERGKEIALRLAESFDLVIENFRPGVMERLGLGYESLAALNPAIIYCSISGYGKNSKEALKPAHDLNLVAEAGVLDLNRRQGERPVIPAIPISDYMAGLLAALSVVSALYKRKETGRGEHLDIGMLDSALSSLNILATMAMYTGLEP
ncbi:MAG: CaiB/BaiF CoA transferase family protein, partial [Candidatus Obscuribacterales bacterium]